jgi:molybdopterin synthase catalytic subunit
MKVLGVVGPSDSGKTSLVEELAAALSERGSVATVKHLTHAPDVDTEGKDTARHRAAGAATTYGLTDDGWFATGDDLSLEEALGRLAPGHDYVLVEGYSAEGIAKVALGDVDAAEPVVATVPEADAVNVADVLAELEGLEPFETLSSLVARAERSEKADRAGAIATFTGRVRRRDGPDDPPTEYLEFEKYDGVADARMAALAEELAEREGVHEVLMHHRTGVVEAGEDVVFVVVLAGHRAEAFRTVEDGIDRLKEEVPIFKKEVTVEEEFWRHDGPAE